MRKRANRPSHGAQKNKHENSALKFSYTDCAKVMYINEPKKSLSMMSKAIEKWLNPYNKVIANKVATWIKSEHIEKAYFGYTHHPLPAVQIPFLQAVKAHGHDPKVLEIGASTGRVVYKTLLAGGEVVANDIHKPDLETLTKFVHENMDDLSQRLTIDHGDVLTITSRHHEFVEKFDFIYAQNVMHVFRPTDVSKFISVVYDLLKPGGTAYITVSHVYGVISNQYQGYLKQLENAPQKHQIIYDMLQLKLDDLHTIYSDEGNYFFKPHPQAGFEQAEPDDEIGDDKALNFFSSEMLKDLFVKSGFLVEDLFCMTGFGLKSKCYDDMSAITLPKSEEFSSEQIYSDVFSASSHVSIVVRKPGTVNQPNTEL